MRVRVCGGWAWGETRLSLSQVRRGRQNGKVGVFPLFCCFWDEVRCFVRLVCVFVGQRAEGRASNAVLFRGHALDQIVVKVAFPAPPFISLSLSDLFLSLSPSLGSHSPLSRIPLSLESEFLLLYSIPGWRDQPPLFLLIPDDRYIVLIYCFFAGIGGKIRG